MWWNPETLSDRSKDFLHLLLGLFDVLVLRASEGMYAEQFRAMIRLLFEVPFSFLKERLNIFKSALDPKRAENNFALNNLKMFIDNSFAVHSCSWAIVKSYEGLDVNVYSKPMVMYALSISVTSFNLKVHLKEPENQFRFLSVLWTYNYNLSNQLSFGVDAVLQTRALYIGCVMLTSQNTQKKRQLASATSPGNVHSSWSCFARTVQSNSTQL